MTVPVVIVVVVLAVLCRVACEAGSSGSGTCRFSIGCNACGSLIICSLEGWVSTSLSSSLDVLPCSVENIVEYIDSLSGSHSGLYCSRSALAGSKLSLEYNTGGNIVLLSSGARNGVFLGIAPDLVVTIVLIISGKACK